MTLKSFLPSEYDEERSFLEQMEDLGVEVVKTPTITDVKWLKKGKYKKIQLYDISVTTTGITVRAQAMEMLGTDYVRLGLGKKEGKPVLLIKPTDESDKHAFKITYGTGIRRLSRAAATRVIAQGLPLGQYVLHKVRNKKVYIAVPVSANG